MAYTTIDDPSAYFQTATYTGTGSSHVITNDGNSDMQPDWVWIKNRSHAAWHSLHDSSRGATKGLFTNDSNPEVDHTDSLTSFNSDGFTLGADSSGGSVNVNTRTYVGWQWKANGGTTSSNTDGTITSTVQANTDAGFSIQTFTSASSGNSNWGHGLGVTPDVFITKRRNGSSGWWGHWKGTARTAGGGNNWQYMALNGTAAATSLSTFKADSTTITASTDFVTSSASYLCYAFAEKQGYSKFGKYVGNGDIDGPFVYTGFKPAFVLVKNASAIESWVVYDTARNTFNLTNLKLSPDTADSENNNSGIGGTAYNNIDILSNGFKCRSNNAATNGSGNTIIYMAFAENPFVTSTGIPTTAR